METYEQWTRSEIARLRTEAEKFSTEAATLQRTLDKWLESQGHEPPQSEPLLASGRGARRVFDIDRSKKQPEHGNKNATAMEVLTAASPKGLTTDEIFQEFAGIFGPKYKRSSLRALLWHQKKLGKIALQNGRYVIPAPAALNG